MIKISYTVRLITLGIRSRMCAMVKIVLNNSIHFLKEKLVCNPNLKNLNSQ